MNQNFDFGRWRQDNGLVMYDVFEMLRFTLDSCTNLVPERKVDVDYLCESNLSMIEILLGSLKVEATMTSFDCY